MHKTRSPVVWHVATVLFGMTLAGIATAQQSPSPRRPSLQIRVFSLRNASAGDLVNVLGPIFKEDGIRLAADKRTNTIIVSAREEVLSAVEAVLQKLDEGPAQSGEREAKRETPPSQPRGKQASAQGAQGLVICCPAAGATPVSTLVPEGTRVKKGDLLVRLDKSELVSEAEQLKIELAEIEGGEIRLAEQEVQLSQTSDVALLESQLQIAKLRQDHSAAECEIELKAIEGEIVVASETLRVAKFQHEKLKQLTATGGVSAADAEAAGLAAFKAKTQLELAKAKKELLVQHTHPLKLAQLKLELNHAESELQRARVEAAASRVQAEAQLNAAKARLQQARARLARVVDRIAKCTIYAPTAGVVRYAGPRDASGQPVIRKGAIVREGQPLIVLELDQPGGD